MADQGQKTEKATPRRLLKAREEGNFATARVFVSALQFLLFVALLHQFAPIWIENVSREFAELCDNGLDPRKNIMDVLFRVVAMAGRLLLPVGLMGAAMITITIAVQLVVSGVGIST
jgi:flagellar biosynthetic protein FlhB